jgi:hypothetical protein
MSYFLGMIRGTNDQFIFGYGLFCDIWAPFIEAILLVSVAIFCGKFYGFTGVLLGGIVSTTIIIYIWKPYMLFSKGFKLPVWKYWLPWFKHLGLMLMSFGISKFVLFQIAYVHDVGQGWKEWIISAVIIVLIQSLIAFALFYIGTVGMRDFVRRVFTKIKR